jgi:hypothetical protein
MASAQEAGALLECYDVPDLVQPLQPGLEGGKLLTAMADRTADLAGIIGLFVQPPLRQNLESVQPLKAGILAALLRGEQHDWVRRFLELQRREKGVLFLFEARILSLPPGVAEELGVQASHSRLEEPPDLFVERAVDAGGNVLTSPRLLVHSGQRATLSVSNPVAYIKERNVVTVEPGGVTLVDPVIDVIQEGVLFEGMGVLVRPDVVGLDFSLTVTDIERPIPTIEGPHGAISTPIVHTREVASRLAMALDATMVVPIGEEGGKDLVLLLTVGRVHASDLEDE